MLSTEEMIEKLCLAGYTVAFREYENGLIEEYEVLINDERVIVDTSIHKVLTHAYQIYVNGAVKKKNKTIKKKV